MVNAAGPRGWPVILSMVNAAGPRGWPVILSMVNAAGPRGWPVILSMVNAAGPRGWPVILSMVNAAGPRGWPVILSMVNAAGPRGWPVIGNLPDFIKLKHSAGDNSIWHKYYKQYGPIYQLKIPGELNYFPTSDIYHINVLASQHKLAPPWF